jgi:transcriptional regulator with XRE-family HTH domain
MSTLANYRAKGQSQVLLTLEEIEGRLKDQRLLSVAVDTGLSYSTINKLTKGKVKNYALNTIRRVSNYLLREQD